MISRLLSRLQGSQAVLLTLITRGLGGVAGVLPPMVALAFLDHEQYGLASANYALALFLIGPVAQYIGQGYFRDIVALKQGTLLVRPVGTSVIYVYPVVALVILVVLSLFFGFPHEDAYLTAGFCVIAVVSKMQESHLIALDRQKTAILYFYILPPVLYCLSIGVAKLTLPAPDFWVVSIGQFVAYGGVVILSCIFNPGSVSRLLPPIPPRSMAQWSAEFRSVRIFFGTGIILAATEQVPTLLFKAFGAAAFIPNFELARKLGSVVAVMAHAFGMQWMPRLVEAARDENWRHFSAILRSFLILLTVLSLTYVVSVYGVLMVVRMHSGLANRLDMVVISLLLCGALITAVAAPFGAALIALHGEAWLLAGPALSLAMQIGIAVGFYGDMGPTAIVVGVLAQNLVLSAIVVCGTILIMQRRGVWRAAASGALP